MKNNQTKRILALLTAAIVIPTALIVGAFNKEGEKSIGKAGEQDAFSFALNSANGKINDSTYTNSLKTISTSLTSSGNNFSLSYYHAKAKSGAYCVLDAHNPRSNNSGEDGYLYTTNGVSGLNEITINYSYENGSVPGDLLVYFSDSTTFSDDPVIAESNKPITANGSYFKIQALSQSVVINSISVNYGCDQSSHIYPEEATAEHTNKPTTSLTISEPTNTLPSDFAFGVDMSMVAETEYLGGTYKNENNVAEDPFQILADDGANYARIRLWANPFSTNGDSYEGGQNDIETDIHLARRAKAAGMKVLLDIHYSDFWADPTHQWKPKSWTSATTDKVTTYTTEVLNRFKSEGITIDSVQIGNEINAKFIGTSAGTSSYYALLNAGVNAAKNVFPSIKTIIHLTNINRSTITGFVNNICNNVNNFDILGLSYYPFWHEGLDNLLSVCNLIASKGKDVMVVETSWGFTLANDPNWYSNNQFNSDLASKANYAVSAQGQMDELCAVIDVLSKVNNNRGKGVFYWGPDYMPVKGAHWASKAGQYYNDHGTDGSGSYDDDSCRISWANQSLFDYNGKVLGSAQTYKLLKDDASPVDPEPTTYIQDTTDITYAVVTYTGTAVTDWGTTSAMTYDETTDNWTASITISNTQQNIMIYSSHLGSWTSGGVDGWYLMSIDQTLFSNVKPYLPLSTGTYNLTIKDSEVDGDVNTCFGYYMQQWSNEGILNAISISKA